MCLIFHFHIFDESLSGFVASSILQRVHSGINNHVERDLYQNISFFIGLGGQKCASTYFQKLLNQTMELIVHRRPALMEVNVTIKQHLHYWHDCIITQYLPSSLHQLNKYLHFIGEGG